MTNFWSFENLQLIIEIGSSFGILLLSIGALIYIIRSKDRVQSAVNIVIFVTLIIAFIFQATLSVYDLQARNEGYSLYEKSISNILYALQFFFQWLSLLIFTLEYLSVEQEVRKVLGRKSTKRKRELYLFVTLAILVAAVAATYGVCILTNNSFYDSWVSSLGEACVAGALFTLQGAFIRKIFILIKESDLDLIPVRRTFCKNLSVVGFIFLVQCGDVFLHFVTEVFSNETEEEKRDDNQTIYLILGITISLLLYGAYFSFFLLIFRSTKGARNFHDVILGKDVPELVFLQTRKLLRDEHYQRAEIRRSKYSAAANRGSEFQQQQPYEDEDDGETIQNGQKQNVSKNSKPLKNVSFSPKLQDSSRDGTVEETERSKSEAEQPLIADSRESQADLFIKTVDEEEKRDIRKDTNRLSHSQIEMKVKTNHIVSETVPQSMHEHSSLSSMVKQNTLLERNIGHQTPQLLQPTGNMTKSGISGTTSGADNQSYYTAQDIRSAGMQSNRRTETDFMSALESQTPYQQLGDKPVSIEQASSQGIKRSGSVHSSSNRQYSSQKSPSLKISEEEPRKESDAVDGRSITLDDNDSDYDRKLSSHSDEIRQQAQHILKTYEWRLRKVGYAQFQVRLNMFFTFVVSTSVEAEAHDYLCSVEGSVMNDSDSSSVIERDYERTNSRLSQIFSHQSNLSD